ncbi:DUF2989 domain-containing protein [Vibrio sp. SCSIO 43135]|uniref:DUF2989 domain-containing protein n=1 Tax=Vibrio paucivorans TaxID=2829489 RepID=A0A9X3CGD3_9VIBR|nr:MULTISPECIES: DUF2989 domain-containing protein [Vibrio]MCW8335374.1 DUF2989 domain-containing protein [Vibrio paucivorans]USD42021.1 DUF2989 domain-containing protein [Vibrio sp. SCSIO 43135]
MNITRLSILAIAVASLSGCFEANKNTDQLCSSNPELRCEKLNINDGQCRIPRTDLIWHRFEVLKNPSDVNVIEEYRLVSVYRKCLELASQIQPLDQTNVKERRFNALMHTGEEQERIVEHLRSSKSPETLYFLWSQTGDETARREFLQLEGTPKLNTADMQYALATFYTSRDQDKTINLLNNALELSRQGQINTEIFKTLASTHYRLNNKERAYIWAMVAKSFNVPIASEQEIQLLYGFSESHYAKLEKIADNIEDAVKSGSFKRSMIPGQIK